MNTKVKIPSAVAKVIEKLTKEKGDQRKSIEGVVAPWCNPLTLQLQKSRGVCSIPARTPPHERHDKGLRTR